MEKLWVDMVGGGAERHTRTHAYCTAQSFIIFQEGQFGVFQNFWIYTKLCFFIFPRSLTKRVFSKLERMHGGEDVGAHGERGTARPDSSATDIQASVLPDMIVTVNGKHDETASGGLKKHTHKLNSHHRAMDGISLACSVTRYRLMHRHTLGLHI